MGDEKVEKLIIYAEVQSSEFGKLSVPVLLGVPVFSFNNRNQQRANKSLILQDDKNRVFL